MTLSLDTESMTRIHALWSWAVRADTGQVMVAVAKLSADELQECLDAADRLKGWVHLQQMVRERQRLAEASLTPDAVSGGVA